MKQYRCILWDWNGTLADDAETSRQAVNDMLDRRSMPNITMEQYYSYMDTPIRKFYEHLFDFNEISMDEIAAEFQAGYARHFKGLHAGAEELLKILHEKGIYQVILSSSAQTNILRDVQGQRVERYFDRILGADNLYAQGKIERGKAWLDTSGFSPDDILMAGDSLHDFETARALGVDIVLTSIGHQSQADLLTAGVPLTDSFGELAAYMLKMTEKSGK